MFLPGVPADVPRAAPAALGAVRPGRGLQLGALAARAPHQQVPAAPGNSVGTRLVNISPSRILTTATNIPLLPRHGGEAPPNSKRTLA